MVDQKLLNEVVKKINTFQSPERKEESFKVLNGMLNKSKEIDDVKEKVLELQKQQVELMDYVNRLNKEIIRDVKLLQSITEKEKAEKDMVKAKQRTVEIPIILVWD